MAMKGEDRLLFILLDRFVKTHYSLTLVMSTIRSISSDIRALHIGVKRIQRKLEIFRKIEPYLTFLNVHQLERQGADIQTKVEELEELNQSLRQRDKVKDDAISQMSNQLVTLSVRLQDIERRQGTSLSTGITA